MRFVPLHLAILSFTLTLSQPFLSPDSCQALAAPSKDGRAGAWRKGTQGAPDLKAAQAKVDKSPQDPEALNDLGFALRQNQKLAEAEKYLKKAIEIKPDMATAHTNLSVVYFDQGKYKESLAEAKAAVNSDANNAIFRVVLGNALSKTGDLKGAVQEYKVAIHLQADYENAHYHLGRVLAELNDTNEAKYELAKALELDPKDDRVVMLLDKLEKGENPGKTAESSAPAKSKSKASDKGKDKESAKDANKN